MPPFKDEHILIIAPGSQTTFAQLGLPESFIPPKDGSRFPTRMFPAEKDGEWEPHRIKARVISAATTNGATTGLAQSEPIKSEQDVEMHDADQADQAHPAPTAETDAPTGPLLEPHPETDGTVYEDDRESTEGAVYPLQEGRIEDWPCFLAFLTHIYNAMSPPFHTPVLVISQPCWSARDHELLTQYFFETHKIPALCLMDAALAACYAYGVPTATVVDVGLDKCDVSAVTDFVVNAVGRGVAIQGCGGRDMTRRLHRLLENQGFTEDMCEQLKKNAICEVLPVGTPLPSAAVPNGVQVTNPAAAASTGATESGIDAKDVDGLRPGQAPRGPGLGTDVGQEGDNGDEDENEGVLDVAAIVAKDNAAELLAKREREKAEKAAAKKGQATDASRAVRLKNSEKEKAVFTVEEVVPDEETAHGDIVSPSRKRKRDVEVGVERFLAATPPPGSHDGILDTVAATIHSTILSVTETSHRGTLWENIIILGNGSRIRGFTPALLSTLAARYTLSPSTATMFTSELPSNFSTPLPTNGTNTPIPGQASHAMHHPAAHGVNPLLVAATKHANQQLHPGQPYLQVPGQHTPEHHHSRMHSQTPTSIKTVKAPDYFPEWKEASAAGMEEAGFLGAQVAAKVIFVVDQGQSKGFLTRGEYNDLGPAGIHECSI